MRVEEEQAAPGDGWVDVEGLVEHPARPRPRKRALTPDQVALARVLAAEGHSLREITVIVGAGSRESLRHALREPVALSAK